MSEAKEAYLELIELFALGKTLARKEAFVRYYTKALKKAEERGAKSIIILADEERSNAYHEGLLKAAEKVDNLVSLCEKEYRLIEDLQELVDLAEQIRKEAEGVG